MSDDVIEGLVLGGSRRGVAIPEQPGFMHVRVMRSSDGRPVGWRVRVMTVGGLPIIELHAVESEVVAIFTPHPRLLVVEKSPGPIWWYGGGDEVGFAAGLALARMSAPGAVLNARTGPLVRPGGQTEE